MPYTVKRVADLAGVSVRTLHHYDHVGVLKPTSVSPAGYRLYTDADLERLQQILFFRELGFSLQEIREIVDSPGFDRKRALLAHRAMLLERKKRLERLIRSVDLTIEALEKGIEMDKHAMFEGFDEAAIQEHRERYRDEARAKYGAELVDAVDERVGRYTREDWAAIKTESAGITRAMAALMDRDPADPEVQEQVGRWFRLINDRFYACTPEVFRGLGDLYVEDPRFTAFYDRVKPGLAAFMWAAMHVYADRQPGAG